MEVVPRARSSSSDTRVGPGSGASSSRGYAGTHTSTRAGIRPCPSARDGAARPGYGVAVEQAARLTEDVQVQVKNIQVNQLGTSVRH